MKCGRGRGIQRYQIRDSLTVYSWSRSLAFCLNAARAEFEGSLSSIPFQFGLELGLCCERAARVDKYVNVSGRLTERSRTRNIRSPDLWQDEART